MHAQMSAIWDSIPFHFRTGGVRDHPSRVLHGHLPLRLLQEGLGRRGPRVRLGLLGVQRPDGAGVRRGNTVQVRALYQIFSVRWCLRKKGACLFWEL